MGSIAIYPLFASGFGFGPVTRSHLQLIQMREEEARRIRDAWMKAYPKWMIGTPLTMEQYVPGRPKEYIPGPKRFPKH